MKRFVGAMLVIAVLLTGAVALCAQQNTAPQSAPMAALDFIKRTHPHPFGTVSEADFTAEAKRLDAQWDQLTAQGEADFALMRLVASLGDEHTTVASAVTDAALPFLTMRVGGEIIVVQAQAHLPELVGKALVSIGGVPVEDVYERMLPYLSGETDGWRGAQFAQALTSARMLVHVGAMQDTARVTVRVRDVMTGEETETTADTLPGGYDYASARIMPLAQTLMQSGYYYATLLKEGELFIQYNTCAENPQMPMADFADALWAQMGGMQPEKILVDLRHNSGGDSRVIAPLLTTLKRFMENGSTVYALIGAQTFSSGMLNAADLREIGAVLLGEETGGVLGYGELKMCALGDGLTLYCSSKDFSGGAAQHEPVTPDVTIEQTAEDFVRGVDSVVAWVRKQR